MKKFISISVSILLIILTFAGCKKTTTVATSSQTTSLPKGVSASAVNKAAALKLITFSQGGAKAVQQIAQSFHKKYPNWTLDVTVLPNVDTYNTVMTAKFSSGDVPDIMQYQYGSNTSLYAQGGHVLDLTNTDLLSKCKSGTDTFSKYNDKVYSIPIDMTVSGLFENMDVAKKYGVTTQPKDFSEFISTCKQFANKGLKSPIILAAKDGSALNAFVFNYIYLNMNKPDPNFYAEMLKGTNHWNGSAFHSMLNDYAQMKPYCNSDALGTDTTSAYQKFDSNEGAFYIGNTADIAHFRQGNPNININMYPGPWQKEESGLLANTDVDTVMSISSTTKYPDAAIAFLDYFTTVDEANIYAAAAGDISAVKNTKAQLDKALDTVMPYINAGKTIGYYSRQWIPGIKDIMKSGIQQWYAGQDIDTVLNHIESEHQRLMQANPTYVQNYLAANPIK